MKKILLSILLFMIVSLFCTGCSGEKLVGTPLAVVVGPRSNEPAIPLNAVTIQNAIYECCYSYASVSYVCCDGNPKVVYQTYIPQPDVSGLSENKKKSIAEGYSRELINELTQMKATTPEVDTLKAICYASMTLGQNCDDTEKRILIMDNGLSTSGYLDFTKDILYADTTEIVKSLKEAEAIPDLSGISVTWMYLGQTAAPQGELSEAQKHKLENIWGAILEEGGAKEITFAKDIATDAPDENLPKVSVINTDERTIQIEIDIDLMHQDERTDAFETIILDSSSVQFIGDTAEFVDYEEASNVLKETANLLLEHPDNKVYVIGTTATGNQEFCKDLSIDRANVVRDILVYYGVSEDRLETIGMGYKDPWHIDDLDGHGNQIEEYAGQNRKVLIVDEKSAEALLINDFYGE